MTHRAKWVFFIAAGFLVVILYGLPDYLHLRNSPSSWMALSGPPDQEFYLTLVEEVSRGKSDLISPYWGGYENVHGSPLPSFSFKVLGTVQRLLHLSPMIFVHACNLLLPLAFFLLLYALCRRIGLVFETSLIAAFISVSSPFLLYGEPAFLYRVLNFTRAENYDYFQPLTRFINPQAGAPLFAAALLFVFDKNIGRRLILGSLFSALCMASNFFMGTGLVAILCADLIIGVVTKRNKKEISITVATVVAAIVPFVYTSLEIARLGKIFPDMYTLDMAFSRLPLITKGEIIVSILLILHVFFRRRQFLETPRDKFVVAIALGYIASMNQQIITGRIVDSWHYEYYVFNFLMPIIAATVLSQVLENKRKNAMLAPIFSGVLIVLCFADGMIEQLHGSRIMNPIMISMEREYKNPFAWLEANVSESKTILGFPYPTAEYPTDVTSYIPIYTKHKVVMSSASTYYPLPGMAESHKRHLIVFALMGMDDASFQANVVADSGVFHYMFFHKSSGRGTTGLARLFDTRRVAPLTFEEITDAVRDYSGYRNMPVEKLLETAKVDYIYWGPSEKARFARIKPEESPFLEKVYSDGTVDIYRVKNLR